MIGLGPKYKDNLKIVFTSNKDTKCSGSSKDSLL